MGGDGARPIGYLRPQARGGERVDHTILTVIADPVHGKAVNGRYDHAAVTDLRGHLGQVPGQDLRIGRVVVGAGVEDDYRLRGVIAFLKEVVDLVAVVAPDSVSGQRHAG